MTSLRGSHSRITCKQSAVGLHVITIDGSVITMLITEVVTNAKWIALISAHAQN